MLVRLAIPAALGLGLALAPAARAADMLTGWEATALPQDQCLNRAGDRLRELGYRVTVTGATTFAWRGQDGVSVRCIGEKQVAVIFVYTTTGEADGRSVLNQVHAALRGAPAPSGGGGEGKGGGKF